MSSTLLPSNATPWERVLADAMPPSAEVRGGIDAMRRFKYVSPRPSMLPFLVWEYGLGELTPYVPSLYDLIEEGIAWQRVRGTISAIAIGLAWIGYAADVEEAWTGRRFWNSFQLRFPSLPGRDLPDLEQIEGITALSVPKRSKLRRGVFHYDVAPLQADYSPLDGSMLDVESGIAVTEAGTIWSFGRPHEIDHQMSKAEGEALGNWIEPVDESGLLWLNMSMPWTDAEFEWAAGGEAQRRAILSTWFVGRELHARFSRADGSVIGYRRCRAVHQVSVASQGAYAFGSQRFAPISAGTELYVEALTNFGDVDGEVCAQIALVIDGELADGLPPAMLWLAPHELSGGHLLAVTGANLPMRATVREQVKFKIRFDNPAVPVASLRFSLPANSQFLPLLEAMGWDGVSPPLLGFDISSNSQYLTLLEAMGWSEFVPFALAFDEAANTQFLPLLSGD